MKLNPVRAQSANSIPLLHRQFHDSFCLVVTRGAQIADMLLDHYCTVYCGVYLLLGVHTYLEFLSLMVLLLSAYI
jgi:hypothetical protein